MMGSSGEYFEEEETICKDVVVYPAKITWCSYLGAILKLEVNNLINLRQF